MTAHAIKNIIFDFGGVIFEIEHELTARSFEELGLPGIRQNFSHLAQDELFREMETGGVDPKTFRDEIRRMSDVPLEDEQIDEAWNAMLVGLPEGNIELLLQLKEQYRSFLLSNTNEIHYAAFDRLIRDRWNTALEDCFEEACFSHRIRLRKPDERAYRHVLERHGLNPAETLFIDDTPVNIEAAGAVGLQTMLVKRNAPLRETVARFTGKAL